MKIMINGETVDATPEQESAMNLLSTYADKGIFTMELQIQIDSVARQKQYSDGVSCASYVTSSNSQWASEATTFIQWRDRCFEYAYDYLQQVESGAITNPTIQEFLLGLPAIEWPTN